MASSKRLRDKAGMTRTLILAHLQSKPGSTLSNVAHGLGITTQAVSIRVREMTQEGALERIDGRLRLAPRGLQELHESIRQLREAVEELATPLADIEATSAIATEPIQSGDTVGLFMQDGDLAARPATDAASRGRARNQAMPGDEVIVDDLVGVVELQPGRITVISIPSPVEGGIRCVRRGPLRRRLRSLGRPDLRGAHGTGARVLARQLHDEVDLLFAADHGAFNGAERGLSVHLYVSRDLLPETMQTLERLNARTLRRVPITLLEAPEA